MTIYSAYIPPIDSTDSSVNDFRLIPDAKAPFALVFTPFWLVWHRLWIELLVYAVFIMGLILIALWEPGPIIRYLSILPGLYMLLEGNEHIRYRLERLGWQFSGVVEAENQEEAGIRFLLHHGEQLAIGNEFERKPKTRSTPALRPVHQAAGLFPE